MQKHRKHCFQGERACAKCDKTLSQLKGGRCDNIFDVLKDVLFPTTRSKIHASNNNIQCWSTRWVSFCLCLHFETLYLVITARRAKKHGPLSRGPCFRIRSGKAEGGNFDTQQRSQFGLLAGETSRGPCHANNLAFRDVKNVQGHIAPSSDKERCPQIRTNVGWQELRLTRAVWNYLRCTRYRRSVECTCP